MAQTDVTVPMKIERPGSSLQVQRNINLISEESGEDEASGPNTPRMSSREESPPGDGSPGSFYRSPIGARSMPSLHFLRMRANTNERLQQNQTVLVPMADPASNKPRGSPTRAQRTDTTISIQSAPALARDAPRPDSLQSGSMTFGDGEVEQPGSETPSRASSQRGGNIKQRLKETYTVGQSQAKKNCTIS